MLLVSNDLFQWKTVFGIRPLYQALAIVCLYVLTTVLGFLQYRSTGLLFGYPVSISLLFVPIYEEIVFRGMLLGYLEQRYSGRTAVVVSSVLFGLWHLKNIFFLPLPLLLLQILETTIVIGPCLGFLAHRKRTIWPGVILHYGINLVQPVAWLAG